MYSVYMNEVIKTQFLSPIMINGRLNTPYEKYLTAVKINKPVFVDS